MRLAIIPLLAITAIPLVSSLATADPGADIPTCNAHPNASCAEQARTSQWVVENFDYHASYIFTTPAHQNSHGYVNFDLWNTVVQYTATCNATSDQLNDFFYGTIWYPCTLPSTAPPGAAVTFRFDRPTGLLEINGTVICTQDGRAPVSLQIEANTSLTLTCSDTTWTNPNWTLGSGEFYSDREVKCAPGTCLSRR